MPLLQKCFLEIDFNATLIICSFEALNKPSPVAVSSHSLPANPINSTLNLILNVLLVNPSIWEINQLESSAAYFKENCRGTQARSQKVLVAISLSKVTACL